MVVRPRFVDGEILENIPPEDLFRPHLEHREHVQIGAIRKTHLTFAELDETLDRPIVVPDVGILDQFVDPVHLERDLLVDRNIASNDFITELAVILGRGGVREQHSP